MGFLDRYVNNQVDGSMGPYSLTEEDKKKLKKRGLMTLGATLLATPTGQGGIGQAFGKGLLNANEALQSGGQDMMQQKFMADKMAMQQSEFEKQKLINGLAAKHRKPDGSIDMEALSNDYMAIDPIKFVGDTQGVQSSFQGADGNMYVIGRDGKAKNLNVKFNPSLQYKTDSNNNPFAFDKTTGAIAPVGGSPQVSQPPVPMPNFAPKDVRTKMQSIAMKFPGTIASSFERSPKHNAEVGGVRNSQHITGTAGDFVVPPQHKANFIAEARAAGFEAIDENDHIHLELPPSASRGATGFAARTPEDIEGAKAGAAAAAKAEVERQTAPIIAAEVTTATENAKNQAERDAKRQGAQADRTNAADATLPLLDQAETYLKTATGSLVGAARDSGAAVFGKSTTGAQAAAQLRIIAGQLTSKVPRMEGPQSNVDVKLYQQMAGDLGNELLPVETRLAALKELRRLNQKYASQNQKPAPPKAPAKPAGQALSIEERIARGKYKVD